MLLLFIVVVVCLFIVVACMTKGMMNSDQEDGMSKRNRHRTRGCKGLLDNNANIDTDNSNDNSNNNNTKYNNDRYDNNHSFNWCRVLSAYGTSGTSMHHR